MYNNQAVEHLLTGAMLKEALELKMKAVNEKLCKEKNFTFEEVETVDGRNKYILLHSSKNTKDTLVFSNHLQLKKHLYKDKDEKYREQFRERLVRQNITLATEMGWTIKESEGRVSVDTGNGRTYWFLSHSSVSRFLFRSKPSK